MKTPRRMALALSCPKRISTMLTQLAYGGVKCRWKRGRLASQVLTLAWLWVA